MAKRKSFDEKSKGMHKSRKLIIDTVFGRVDNTQRVHGYEGEVKVKREVGEKWTDKDGKEWEQQEGFISAVTQMDGVRSYLDTISVCGKEDCKTIKLTNIDKKLIRKTGMCATCLRKFEQTLVDDGTFGYYEDYKITRNKLAWCREMKSRCEEALSGIKNQIEILGEDGKVEKWIWDIDVDKVKSDVQSDINDLYESIEVLVERKRLLEEKLIEFKHPELIKK
jgi:hypothetical protein